MAQLSQIGKGADMKRIMILVLVGIMLGFTAETQSIPREETLIEIVKAGKPRHPYQDEYERMLYPTVRITAGYSTGSGVVIATTDAHSAPVGARGHASLSSQITQIYILTACHVVEDESTVNIELYDSVIITGTVVITDTVKDLALIRVATTDSHRLPQIYTGKLADKNYTPYLFSPVWAVGCSLGLKPRPSYGHITSIEDSTLNAPRSTPHWEVSCPILPGNSGGPVYDARTYEVIGIAVWVKVYNGQLVTTMAGVVPIGEIHKFLDNHK